MKKMFGIFFGFLIVISLNKMKADDTQAQITFHITTDEGKPLVKFPYQAGSSLTHAVHPGSLDNTVNVSGLTDSNGNVTLTLPSATGEIYSNTKYGMKGYYAAGLKYQFKTNSGDRWQPWNPTIDVVVKPILTPIPMYAQAVRTTIPAKNKAIGYDLEAGDWVAPYGKGNVSDFIFSLNEKVPFTKVSQPYNVTNTLSFFNKGDGIQSVIPTSNSGSSVRMLCDAPQTGYESTLSQQLYSINNKVSDGAVSNDQNYFFRVRTVLDEQGNVKSALYGKISGPIECGAQGYIQFTYYLNPNNNDRNMEFDPKKNLFQNLSDLQQVQAP